MGWELVIVLDMEGCTQDGHVSYESSCIYLAMRIVCVKIFGYDKSPDDS